ncbi:MAG TPA: IS1634 family transposase [Candidatus Xenobia bacterium]
MASQFGALLHGQILRTQPLRVQTIPLVHRILQDVKFGEVIGELCADEGDVPVEKVLEAMVHCRQQHSTTVPLYEMQKWFSNTILPNVLGVPSSKINDVRLGRVLERVAPVARVAWVRLISEAHKAYGLDLSLAIYDTSSVYVEGEYEDSELMRFGYSRDSKPNCKQFNLGLDVTGDDGIPLLYHLTPGNTEDSSTVPENLRDLQRLYQSLGAPDSLCVLGDRAMLTANCIHLYDKAGVNFIGSMKACALNDRVLESVPLSELLSHPLEYVAERYQHLPSERREEERYYAVRTEVTISASKDIEGSVELVMPALVVLGSGKQRLDQQHRETLLAKTEARLADIASYLNKSKYRRRIYAEDQVAKAIKRFPAIKGMVTATLSGEEGNLTLTWTRDDEKIEESARLDGRYVIYFRDRSLSSEMVFSRFKSRDMVEKRIDDVKGAGPVVVRPVFLHKDERICGMVFVCMVALLVVSLQELLAKRSLKTRVTGETIHEVFETFAASVQTFADQSQLLFMPTPTDWQRQLLESAGIRLESVVPVTVSGQWIADVGQTPPWGTNDAPQGASHPGRDP